MAEAKATITIDATDYQISLIPVQGGRKKGDADAAGAGGAKKKSKK